MNYCITNEIGTTTDMLGSTDENDIFLPLHLNDGSLFQATSTALYATTSCPLTVATTSLEVSVDNTPVDNPVLDMFMGVMILYMTAWATIAFFKKR